MSSIKRGPVEEVTLALMIYGLQILFNRDIHPRTPIVAIGQSDGDNLTYSLYSGDEYVGEASNRWDRTRGQVEVLRPVLPADAQQTTQGETTAGEKT